MNPDPERKSSGTRGGGVLPLATRLAITLFWTLAVLQGAVFVGWGPTPPRVISIAVALGTSAFVLAPLSDRWRLVGAAVLGMVGFGNFIARITLAPDLPSLRLLSVAVLAGYASLWLALGGAVLIRRVAIGLLVSAMTVTVSVVMVEAMIGSRRPVAGSVRWAVQTVPDPVLEERYVPGTEATTTYPSNPRGYFHTDDPRLSRWVLKNNDPGSAARLLLLPSSDTHDGVHVQIDRAQDPMAWHIQLSYTGVQVRAGERYVVAFRARADQPRTIAPAVTQDHGPWLNLGWYHDMEIGATWRDYVEVFTASGTDDRARLLFNLGASPSAVEIQAVEIKHVETGASAVRGQPIDYSVHYRFNDHGCRGPDYVMPALPNRRRILALGDSYTLGVGVHEEDTFEAQLQTLLNAGRTEAQSATYDVINCGVSGYATRQERQLFEILAPQYRPDIVVLSMVPNDDASFRSDVRNGYVHPPGRYQRLFTTWGLVQRARYEGRKPPPEFSGSLQEVRILKELCARMHVALVVVAFRSDPLTFESWQPLVQTMSAGLAGSGVPWLDLGDGLLADHAWQDLRVHPLDAHPNEVAHRGAAEQIAELLRTNGLLH